MSDDTSADKPTPEPATAKPLKAQFRSKLTLVMLAATLLAALALWWGEGQELARVEGLAEGEGVVTEASTATVDPELEGRLLHLRGVLQPNESLRDDALGVVVAALRLHRSVEMYQWQEQQTEVAQADGSKKTVKSYTKIWSDQLIPSRNFASGHDNPSALPFQGLALAAERAQLGAFVLGQEAVLRLANFEPLLPTREMIDSAPADVRSRLQIHGQSLYLGREPSQPAIGDTRISLQIVRPQPVSVLGAQHGAEVIAYRTKSGSEVFTVQPGDADAAALFNAADDGTAPSTWILRGLSWALFGVALTSILMALRVGGRWSPKLGRFVLPGMVWLGASAAAVVTGSVIGGVWVGQRPLTGALAFTVGALGLATAVVCVLRAKKQRTAASG